MKTNIKSIITIFAFVMIGMQNVSAVSATKKALINNKPENSLNAF